MRLLQVEAVTKAFGGIQALSGCSISIEPGTITGLIGPNGSGKTTLFNVITGYERVDRGIIRFNYKDITRATPEKVFSMGLGRTFQLTRIFPRLTVLENMHVPARRDSLRALTARWTSAHEQRRALELLDFVNLMPHRDSLASDLSYGQKKLLEFAVILVSRPHLILLDEPAGGVNPTMINSMADLISTINKEQGVTFMIVEHNMDFVMRLSHTVHVLHHGTTIASGSPDEVQKNPAVLDAYLGE